MNEKRPIIELSGVGKAFGNIRALSDVDLAVEEGKVSCVLGDNGAGKSTLINIMAGLYAPSEGEYRVDGEVKHFDSPRDALDHGISAVYQSLALVPLMPVWRNFFLGSEITIGRGVARRLDRDEMKKVLSLIHI